MSPLNKLASEGQAVWLDFVERKFLAEGGLQALIKRDGVTGVTSNPSIFEKAMGHGGAYDAALAGFDLAHPDASTQARYEFLAIEDIRAAADDLLEVYDRLDARDGYVSFEVSPLLAMDSDGTIAEAARLWAAVDRPNLMIKIPGTPEGIPAIAASIDAGINVNVTLLFSIETYKTAALAYVHGLEKRAARGQRIDQIASVASVFVSRIDTKMDDAIDAIGGETKALRGKVAIANAKLAYAWYQHFIATDRWLTLAAKGAMPQRLLWASTGTKNDAYSDVMYVDGLIGMDTINTVPPKTLAAFRDHGNVAPTLTADLDGAHQIIADATRLGLDLDGITAMLVDEGVHGFAKAFEKLLAAIAGKHVVTA
jgi:transaldolase